LEAAAKELFEVAEVHAFGKAHDANPPHDQAQPLGNNSGTRSSIVAMIWVI
jgi:hypothetical protein